jgi:hypothetical protein
MARPPLVSWALDSVERMFDTECEPIPPGLDKMPPGPALGAFLASIDVDRVCGYDRVVVLRACQRQASHVQAQVCAAMAAVADHMDQAEFPDDPGLGWEAAATEIRVALRLTRRAAESQMDVARAVRRRLPRVWDALCSGSIDLARARVIVQGTSHLDEVTARRVVGGMVDEAGRLTTGQLRDRLRRLCIQADPQSAAERHDEAIRRRRVLVEASLDGTAHLLGLDLPADRVAEVSRRIDRLAKSLNRTSDPRTMDQLRADVMVDLLAGRGRDTKGGTVDITVDLETLAHLSELPGDLAGYGPVIADIARQVAVVQADGQWRFTITDPRTGLAVHDGTTRRRPTTAQRRSVTSRDRTCIFPGCRMPARQCDLDHRIPWAERHETSTNGLAPGCRHDHVTVRHRIGWRYRPLPGGDHLWTSPLGHTYTTSGREPP